MYLEVFTLPMSLYRLRYFCQAVELSWSWTRIDERQSKCWRGIRTQFLRYRLRRFTLKMASNNCGAEIVRTRPSLKFTCKGIVHLQSKDNECILSFYAEADVGRMGKQHLVLKGIMLQDPNYFVFTVNKRL